ncbi:MAG: hypothetical protein QXO70_02255 [Candidatus Pacearchaeota archaeon]
MHQATLRDDLLFLRRAGQVDQGRNMDPAKKKALMKKILNYIKECEIEGRDYKKGEIGPAEIANALGMDGVFINNFINKNRKRMNLPKRQNPNAGRLQEKRKIKETAKALYIQGVIHTSDLTRILLISYPHFKKDTLRKYTLEAKREIKTVPKDPIPLD